MLPANSPRRRSEAHYDTRYRLDGSVPVIDETWLYKWSNTPPEPFLRHRTVFRQCTPADIAREGWTVLKQAIREISDTFGVQRPEVERDIPPEAERISSNRFELLSLNHFFKCPCLMGLHDSRYVVAAAKLAHKRAEFAPHRIYEQLQRHKFRQQRYYAGYRHFLAKFTTGHTFCTYRHKMPCEVSYGLDLGVHSRGCLWAVINADGVFLPTPERISVSTDLSNLPDNLEQLNVSCQLFVQRLEAMWLKQSGIEPTFKLIRKLSAGTSVPQYVLESLKTDYQLKRCFTRFDVLRAVMQAYYLKVDDTIPSLIPLAQNFIRSTLCPQQKQT